MPSAVIDENSSRVFSLTFSKSESIERKSVNDSLEQN